MFFLNVLSFRYEKGHVEFEELQEFLEQEFNFRESNSDQARQVFHKIVNSKQEGAGFLYEDFVFFMDATDKRIAAVFKELDLKNTGVSSRSLVNS